ncbi:MAG: hypothetical protein RIS76_4484 [Verrucomicrobiota bacterium]|jgi:hypothetical protein
MEDRLQGEANHVGLIQHAVDRMWFSFGRHQFSEGLEKAYVRIVDENENLLGHAALTKVGTKKGRLIVTTILKAPMQPKGKDLSALINLRLPDAKVSAGRTQKRLPKGAKAVLVKETAEVQTCEPEVELLVDGDLKAAAAELLTRWDELYVEGEHCGGVVGLRISFLEPTTATACAKMLWAVQALEFGYPETDDTDPTFENLVAEGGWEVACSIERFIGNWRELKRVVVEVKDTKLTTLPVPASFRRDAEEFVECLDSARIKSIVADSPDQSVHEEEVARLLGMAAKANHASIEFFCLVAARCKEVPPVVH